MTCGPARASLDTGLYTQTHGVGGGFKLSGDTPSLPRALAARGYASEWVCGRAGVAPEHGFDACCAQRAIRFLETNRDRPFACFLQLRGLSTR